MASELTGRNLTSMRDLNKAEIEAIVDLAAKYRKDRAGLENAAPLKNKTLGMIFQKPSLRTRVSFEVGMQRMGGRAVYLAPSDIKLGQRETTEDIAIVVSRYLDIIMARTFGHDIVEEIAKHATVPVINGLSDFEHPCQILADFQTIYERKNTLSGMKGCFIGDGNNVANSLAFGSALCGMDFVVASPEGYEMSEEAMQIANELAQTTGVKIETTNDPKAAAEGADWLYTDVWASMGQEDEAAERMNRFDGFQINADLMKVAKGDAVILHCLPAHYGQEIDYETSRSPNSAIFDQAENRMHAQCALMAKLLGAG